MTTSCREQKHSLIYFATNRRFNSGTNSFDNAIHDCGPSYYRTGIAKVSKSNNSQDHTVEYICVLDEAISKNGIVKLSSTELFHSIRKDIEYNPRDVIVFIHGYMNSFDEAIERGADLQSRYLVNGLKGKNKDNPVMVVFSWPSSDGKYGYYTDRDRAKESGPAMGRFLARFLDYMKENSKCKQRIHLVAHSMGNWALRHAVQWIVTDRCRPDAKGVFQNVFLMAADEDDDAFEKLDKLKPLDELASRIHVYHSEDDTILALSDTLKFNPDRLGQNGPKNHATVNDRIVSIDCENVDFTDDTEEINGNHQYYRLRPEVIQDVKHVLSGIRPDKVPNREVVQPGMRYRIKKQETDL